MNIFDVSTLMLVLVYCFGVSGVFLVLKFTDHHVSCQPEEPDMREPLWSEVQLLFPSTASEKFKTPNIQSRDVSVGDDGTTMEELSLEDRTELLLQTFK